VTGYGPDDWGSIPNSHNIQTGSEVRSASYSKDTGDYFSGNKAAGAVNLATHLYLVPRSITVELYLHSPIRFHGVLLN
jgi:hypothetical protein